jgi:hypothetical protein
MAISSLALSFAIWPTPLNLDRPKSGNTSYEAGNAKAAVLHNNGTQ